MKKASLPTGGNETDAVMALPVMEESKEEKKQAPISAAVETVAGNNKDAIGEEDSEAQQETHKEAEEVVIGSLAAKKDNKELAQEEPNWQWLSHYGPATL